MKLTRLEQLVKDNPRARWDKLADIANARGYKIAGKPVTPGAMERACDRLLKKERAASL